MLKQDLVALCGPIDLELTLLRSSAHLWEASSRLCSVSLSLLSYSGPGLGVLTLPGVSKVIRPRKNGLSELDCMERKATGQLYVRIKVLKKKSLGLAVLNTHS